MHSIALALAWDFWRRSRQTLLFCLAAPLALMLMCRLLLLHSHMGSRQLIEISKSLYFFILILELFAFNGGLLQVLGDAGNRKGGFPCRLFRLPVRTSVLVAWELFFGMLGAIFLSLAIAVLYRLLFGVWLPLAGPALLLAAAYAAVQAIVWSGVDYSMLRWIALGSLLWPLYNWMMPRYMFFRMEPSVLRPWGGNVSDDAPWLMGVIELAYLAARLGVARDRRGDARGLPTLKGLGIEYPQPSTRRIRPFRSPAAAQFWFEWRQKGWQLPLALAFAQLIPLAVYLSSWLHGSPVEGVPLTFSACIGITSLGLPVTALLWGARIGCCNQAGPQSEGALDLFRATRPLDDRALAFGVLRVSAASVLTGWVVCILAVLLVMVFLAWQGPWNEAEAWWRHYAYGSELGLLSISIDAFRVLLLAWLLMNLTMLPLLTGHSYFFTAGFILLITLFLVVNIGGSALYPNSRFWAFLWNLVFITLGLGCPLATLKGYAAARRRGMISTPMLWLSLLFTLVVLTLALLALSPTSMPDLVLLAGLATLPAAPLALGPLAMAWNRHR